MRFMCLHTLSSRRARRTGRRLTVAAGYAAASSKEKPGIASSMPFCTSRTIRPTEGTMSYSAAGLEFVGGSGAARGRGRAGWRGAPPIPLARTPGFSSAPTEGLLTRRRGSSVPPTTRCIAAQRPRAAAAASSFCAPRRGAPGRRFLLSRPHARAQRDRGPGSPPLPSRGAAQGPWPAAGPHAQSPGAYRRGPARGDGHGDLGAQCSRRPQLLRALRLRWNGSTILIAAVGTSVNKHS
jgi:hypothetical protein